MKYTPPKKLIIYLILFSLSLSNLVWAKVSSQSDSLKNNRNSLVALPYAYYTPETKIAFGVGSIYSFRPAGSSPNDRPSNFRMALTYTQLKQTTLSFLPEIYFKNESYYFNGFYGYYKYPDKFWGIGNDMPDSAEEDYEPNYFKSYTNFQKQITPGLYIGIRYQYEYISLKETDENGVLPDGTVPGSDGGSSSGLGFIINNDTRNHIYYPSKGRYYQAYAVFFDKTLGSDYQFNLLTLDLRKYYTIFSSHVLAFQTLDTFIKGTPPFQMMALLGGSYWMRGYYFGRYRDKNMITFQTEYRFPIFWRFGGVGFIGFGDVAANIKEFKINEVKYSFGFGLRFMFDKKEKINARLDLGFSEDGEFGFYAMVVEAF
jgi:hypothetical protein